MATLTQTRRYTPSAPLSEDSPPSYDSLSIEVGQNSSIESVENIAQNHITLKQPTYAIKIKNFFSEKWNATKAYPQAGANKVKNIFNSIYQHPTVPYIGAGLLGTATGLLMGLPIPAGFMLGVAVKLGSMGLEKGLDALDSTADRVSNWIKGSKSQEKNISQSSFKQTMRIVPIAILSFSLGLNSYNLALVAKIAATATVIGAGAFALGTAVHATA